MPLVTPMPKVVLAMVTHGLNWDGANRSLTKGVAARSTADIVAGLRQHADSHFTPPGAGPEAPLTDLLIHGGDMRVPLGLTRDIPEQRLRIALDYVASGKARGVVPADRVSGLRLEADDVAWTGGDPDGSVVSGPGESLLLAVAGRRGLRRRRSRARRRHVGDCARPGHGGGPPWRRDRVAAL